MATELKETEYTQKVRQLNDTHRSLLPISMTVLTRTVASLPRLNLMVLLAMVKTFDAFGEDNDPYGEHDFGAVHVNDEVFYFKIDYFARDDFLHGSEDPSDPKKTTRVLTIMHSSEY